MKMRLLPLTLAALFLAAASPAPPKYHVARHIPVGGEGGWDYLSVDATAHRLYVSHATKVVVIDTVAGKVVGEVTDTPGVARSTMNRDIPRLPFASGSVRAATIRMSP